MLRKAMFFGMIGAASVACAEPAALKNQVIKDLIPGSVINLDTPVGSQLPVRYADDGQMSGEAGGLASYLGAATDRGKWWVERDRLCHKWQVWFDGEVQCLQLRQQGKRISWVRDDGKTGTATITMRPAPTMASMYTPAAPPYAMGMQAAQPEPSERPEPRKTLPSDAAIQAAPKSAAARPPAPKAVANKPVIISQLPPEKPVSATQSPELANIKDKLAPAGRITSPQANATPKPSVDQSRLALATPAPVASKPPAFKVAGVEEDDVLNIRSGPSAEHDPIGAIPAFGQGVIMVGACQADWCPIVYRGISGWVNRVFLAEDGQQMQGSAWLGSSGSRERRLPN